MRILLLPAAIVVAVLVGGDRGHAQVQKRQVGPLFLGGAYAKTVTINRNGALLGTFTFAKGTVISAVDDHRGSQLLADGRWEFHGAFELRALPDKEPAPYQNTPAEVLMSDAPVVVSAHGVDVILECLPEQ